MIRVTEFVAPRWERWLGLELGDRLILGDDLPRDGEWVAAWSAGPYTGDLAHGATAAEAADALAAGATWRD